jgi:hypothetical protein
MNSLEAIISINNRPAIRRDNFNRDSSGVKSRGGFVIHSGIHRSTAFVDAVDHAECHAALTYWRAQGQAAENGFIESIVGDTTLEDAEACAFARSRPGWHVRTVKPRQRFAGGLELVASRGKLPEIQAAATWRQLHGKTA